MAAVSLFWKNTNMTAVTSCENAHISSQNATFPLLLNGILSYDTLYQADTSEGPSGVRLIQVSLYIRYEIYHCK